MIGLRFISTYVRHGQKNVPVDRNSENYLISDIFSINMSSLV